MTSSSLLTGSSSSVVLLETLALRLDDDLVAGAGFRTDDWPFLFRCAEDEENVVEGLSDLGALGLYLEEDADGSFGE